MQMIFSFDTEDYVDPASNDALLRLAQMHSAHGVPATFGLVGEKARFVHFCGRDDVVRALRDHEVAYHSDHHFILPNWRYPRRHMPDWVANENWDAALDRLLAEESRGLADIEAIFGVRPVTQLRNYADWTPQVMVTHARLGLAVHAYGPVFHSQDPRPIWYCNQLQVANPRHMYEYNLHQWDKSPAQKLEEWKAAVLQHLEQGTQRLGWVNHPTRFIADHWWEEPNWWDTCRDPHRREWRAPGRLDPAVTNALLDAAGELIRFVSEQAQIECLTFRDFAHQYRQTRVWVTREEIMRLSLLVTDRPAMVELDGEWFSPAELFGVFAHALGAPEGAHALQRSPLRRIIGPTEEPVATRPGEVKRADLIAAAREAEYFIRDFHRVPARIALGAGECGPGAFLLAMAEALREPDRERITIAATDNLPVPLHEDDYEVISREGRPMGYIQFHSDRDTPDFSQVRRHAMWQYWTVKLATRA